MMHPWSHATRAVPSARSASVALGIVLALAASGCSDSVGPGEVDAPTDRILFVSSRDGVPNNGIMRWNIYSMSTDGSEVENLTQYPSIYGELQVTPNGRTVLFVAAIPGSESSDDCPTQVWSMATDGSRQQQVTSGLCSSHPRLSPDGTRIAYYQGFGSIFVANVDGSSPRDVSHALPPVSQGCSPEPKWDLHLIGWESPDRVMFSRHICGRGTSWYSVDINGNGLLEIDSDASSAYLSPDQTRIVYRRHATSEVTVMNTDGSGVRVLTTGSLAGFPTHLSPWSPDGTRIIYSTFDGSTFDGFHVINADGTGDRKLAYPQISFDASFSGWSPDGDQILFDVFDRTSTGAVAAVNVYVANVDGSGVENLTDQAASFNQGAVWVKR